jgi:hypothetical protein
MAKPSSRFAKETSRTAEMLLRCSGVSALSKGALSTREQTPRKRKTSGLMQQPIPQGPRSPYFLGDELIVPPAVFELFDRLRRSGEIVVSPVS